MGFGDTCVVIFGQTHQLQLCADNRTCQQPVYERHTHYITGSMLENPTITLLGSKINKSIVTFFKSKCENPKFMIFFQFFLGNYA